MSNKLLCLTILALVTVPVDNAFPALEIYYPLEETERSIAHNAPRPSVRRACKRRDNLKIV